MTTEEERRRAVAAIDAQIAALLEDGVPADSSRIRALKAKRVVARKSQKAIKRSVRKARERRANELGVPLSAPRSQATPERGVLAPASTTDQKRLEALPQKQRKRFEQVRKEVRQTLSWCGEPTTDGVNKALARYDQKINALIDKGVRYEANERQRLRLQRRRLKELSRVLAARRRKSPPSELELALLLHDQREQIRRGPDNVVGVLDMRSGGAPSLGKRK